MLPPDWQAKRGRLQKKRIRSAGGPGGVQPKKAHRCANCTLLGKPGQGHYARNCPFPPFLPGVIAALPGASDRAACACKGLQRGASLAGGERAVQELLKTGWPTRTITEQLAAEGDLAGLKAARSAGCHWGRETCARAAEHGDLGLLKWARAQGCQLERCTWGAAAGNGHLHVLKWLKHTGCPGLDHSACTAAARGNRLAALQWLVEVCRLQLKLQLEATCILFSSF
eukprot:jgi/Tetstr1/437713/TSEL_026367.t1